MIKNFKQFTESVSGTELVGPVGPGYGETGLQNKTVTAHDTETILSDVDDRFYNIDDYNNLYNDFLKNIAGTEGWRDFVANGGAQVTNDFNRQNLDTILTYLTIRK